MDRCIGRVYFVLYAWLLDLSFSGRWKRGGLLAAGL
jgi:hypothetical protein